MTERVRVLVMIDSADDDAGGAERFAVATAISLPSDRFEVTLCATHGIGGRPARDLEAAGVGRLALERRGRFDLLAFKPLVRLLRSPGRWVVHSHKFGSNVWGTLVGRACGVAVVVAHEHTWSYEGRPLRKLVDGRFIGRLASAFVAVSEADRRRMVEIERVPAEKTRVIPTAYIPRGDTLAGDLREEWGIPAGVPVIGTVARLRPQKALEVLIDAFARVVQETDGARLVIVGDGESRLTLEAAASAAGLGGSVIFPGQRTDLGPVLRTFDVAAMSSDFEGLPLFVFECMAHGVPLVATEVGGIPEVVTHGVTGLLAPARDPEALYAALVRLLADRELAARMAQRAREDLSEYTVERAGERLAALYEDLLSGVRSRG